MAVIPAMPARCRKEGNEDKTEKSLKTQWNGRANATLCKFPHRKGNQGARAMGKQFKTPNDSRPPIEDWEEWTPKELASHLKVKSGTVYSWIARGVEMPPYTKIGGTVRFRVGAVKQWIEDQEQARKLRNFEA